MATLERERAAPLDELLRRELAQLFTSSAVSDGDTLRLEVVVYVYGYRHDSCASESYLRRPLQTRRAASTGDTLRTMREEWARARYALCPHSAIAVRAARDARARGACLAPNEGSRRSARVTVTPYVVVQNAPS